MYERNRDRSFAYGRSNTLYIAAAHVSGGKNARQCCLQQVWPAAERPVRVVQFLRRQIGTGLDEAFAIEHDAAAEPLCIRVGSSHDKYVSNALVLGFTGLIVSPRDSFQVAVAFEIGNLCMCEQGDIGGLFDTTDQIFRHRFRQARASDEHVNVVCALSEKYSRLSCGISAADHDYVFATAQLCLNEGCAVIDAGAFKTGQILDRQLAVLGSRSDNERSRRDVE